MDTKIVHSANTTKTAKPPMSIEVSAFDRELPYLTAQGVPFEILQKEGDFIRIKIIIADSYALAAYGIGMSNYGFDMAKAVYLKRKEVAV